jgi:two-component system, LuxR family, response regulator FixJ
MKVVNVVDNDSIVCESLKIYLEVVGFTVRLFDSATAFLQAVDASERSVTLISFSLSSGGGVGLVDELRHRSYSTRVVMVSDGEDTTQIVRAMRLGVVDVLVKPFSSSDLERSIRLAFSDAFSDAESLQLDSTACAAGNLSSEEEQILMLLCEGCTVKQVASKLDLSVRTIHYRKNSIFGKMGVKNRSEAISRIVRDRPRTRQATYN